MICSKCGLEVDAGAAFCGNCGQPVQQVATQPVAQGAAPMAPAAPVLVSAPMGGAAVAQPFPTQNPANVAPAAPQPQPVMSGPGAAAAALPGQAYGLPAAYSRPGGGKAIASFVLGIIGLIGWLIPIVGVILGILALVFGTMTTKSSHRNLAIAGIVLGSITVLMSLGAFVYNVQQVAKDQATGTAYSSSTASLSWATHEVLVALTTPRNQ